MKRSHSCQRVAELASQRLDEPLGFLDRFRLRVHLYVCGNCRNVDQQLAEVHAMSAKLFSMEDPFDDVAERAPRSPGVQPPTA